MIRVFTVVVRPASATMPFSLSPSAPRQRRNAPAASSSPTAPADARHESAGSFGFDARLIRQHHRDIVFDRVDTPASGTFQALAVGRKPDGRLTHGADKDLEQLFAHRHGNLLRANRPTVADANCRKQLPRLTSPLIARVFRPRGSSAKAIYKPRLQRDKLQAPASKEFSHHLRTVLALAVHGIV